MKKTHLFALLLVVLNLNCHAGILNTECIDVDKNGNLFLDNQSIACKRLTKFNEFNSSHAMGKDKIISDFDISVKKNNADEFVVTEVANDGFNTSLRGEFALHATGIKNGNIKDHTICSRNIQKSKPFIHSDNVQCVTINENICSSIFSEMTKLDSTKDAIKKINQTKECQNLIDEQLSAITKTLDNSFAKYFGDKEYQALSKKRFEDLKEATAKVANKNLMSSIKFDNITTETDFKSINLTFKDTAYGLKWSQSLFNKCLEFFLPNESRTNSETEKMNGSSK